MVTSKAVIKWERSKEKVATYCFGFMRDSVGRSFLVSTKNRSSSHCKTHYPCSFQSFFFFKWQPASLYSWSHRPALNGPEQRASEKKTNFNNLTISRTHLFMLRFFGWPSDEYRLVWIWKTKPLKLSTTCFTMMVWPVSCLNWQKLCPTESRMKPIRPWWQLFFFWNVILSFNRLLCTWHFGP